MNWGSVVHDLIVASPAILLGLATLIQVLRTRKDVDGRMSELLDLTRKAATADATLAEKHKQEIKQEVKQASRNESNFDGN